MLTLPSEVRNFGILVEPIVMQNMFKNAVIATKYHKQIDSVEMCLLRTITLIAKYIPLIAKYKYIPMIPPSNQN